MVHPDRFWTAILNHPCDDEPRLAYAAWLDEHCDPLGEFIRVQCRIAKGGGQTTPVAMLELETRERELLAEFEMSWVGDLADKVDFWVFRRGLIQEIGISAENYLHHAESLFAQAPILEVHLGRVRDRLHSLTEIVGVGTVSCSTCQRGPRYLDLSGNYVRDQGAKKLASSPHLSHLVGLNLSSSGLGDAGLKALADSPYLNNLRELYLGDNRISNAGARALATSSLANQLHMIHLRYNDIGTDGAELLQRRLGKRVVL